MYVVIDATAGLHGPFSTYHLADYAVWLYETRGMDATPAPLIDPEAATWG